jgi:hypothetical protein
VLGYGRRRRRPPAGHAGLDAHGAWLGRRLRRLAREAPKTGALPPFELVFSSDNMLRVFGLQRSTAGPAPGPDELTYASLSSREAAHLLRAVAGPLSKGTYRPGPERAVVIPKRSGGTRTLRLRSILDRIVAAALAEALEPLLEGLFLPLSYGFRRGRSVWHLLADLEAAMIARNAWVVTVDDVRKAFDTVTIDQALGDFEGVVAEYEYLILIDAVLRGADRNRKEGICQGCPFSPTALNLHLHLANDLAFSQGDPPSPAAPKQHTDYVHDLATREVTIPFAARYADNLVYLTANVSEGNRARERAADRLKPTGLSLKGPGRPTDLRTGGAVDLLGLSLRYRKGTIGYSMADGALSSLEESLEEAHLATDPPQAARRAVCGWARAMGPAFESSAVNTVPTVLKLGTNHGFPGLLSEKEIRASWGAGYRSWLSLRATAVHRRGLD